LAAKKIWAIGTRREATISAPARASCSAWASRPPHHRQPERDMFAGGQLLPAGQDLIGGAEETELVQRLAQQQRPGCIQVLLGHRLDQPAHGPKVVRIPGQVGAADQDGWVRPSAGVQPPHRDPQRRRALGADHFQPAGLGQQDRPHPPGRQH
jgi:hypothetical protein